jgi:hypothetical protein
MLTIVQTDMYFDRCDAEKNLDALLLITCGISAVSKIMWFRIRPTGLISNSTSALEDYNELKDQEKRVIVRGHAYMDRVACASEMFFGYFALTLMGTIPILAAEEEENILNMTELNTMEYPVLK